jgi:hypothetical protein
VSALLVVAYVGGLAGLVILLRGGDDTPRIADASLTAAQRLPRAEVREGTLYRLGEKFAVKGVGWDRPLPPDTPWHASPDPVLAERDFQRIRAAGFNTIRTWRPLPPQDLVAAERQGLAVLLGLGVDPRGSYGDPGFAAEQHERVREIVRASRASDAILAYVITNEPAPRHVLAQGLTTTATLLNDLAETIREEDPGALVCFSSWPRLEHLRPASFDLTAVNLYPSWPPHVVGALGYEGLVRVWADLAGPRPLLVTEYGVPVASEPPEPRWGVTEPEQASTLPRLADAVARAGAAGGAVFSWVDGWWKHDDYPGDELVHDPGDFEEWFGLNALTSLDGDERARPALAAMRAWNRAVVTLPIDGPLTSPVIPIEAYVEEPGAFHAEVSMGGGEPARIELTRDGAWLRGELALPEVTAAPQRARIALHTADGERVTQCERTVYAPGRAPRITLTVNARGPLGDVTATATGADGSPLPDTELRLVTLGASERLDRSARLRTDAAGRARAEVELPNDPESLLVICALRQGDDGPLLALATTTATATPAPTAQAADPDRTDETTTERVRAHLEPQRGLRFGVSLDDTSTTINVEQRLGTPPDAFVTEPPIAFPMDPPDRLRLERFLAQCTAGGRLAVVRLAPVHGLDRVTDAACADFAATSTAFEDRGADILVSFADGMNAPWTPWGLQPQRFQAGFRLLANHLHRETERAAMLWAPVYGGGMYAAAASSPAPDVLEALDTDGDGRLTTTDDPYAPYYPGDDATDWVGLRIAHWDNAPPWGDNDIPEADRLVQSIRGRYRGSLGDQRATPDFYARFVRSDTRRKPMALLDTAALFNPARKGASEQEIKLAWLQQVFGATERLPGIALVTWRETVRIEAGAADGARIDWRISHSAPLRAELRRLMQRENTR